MSHPWRALSAILVFFSLIGVSASAINYIPNEVIVKYKDGSFRVNSTMSTLYESAGVADVHYYSGAFKNFEHLTLKGSASVTEAIAVLQADPSVEYAEPNYIVSIPEKDLVKTEARTQNPGALMDIPCIPGIIDPPLCNPNACLIPGLFPPGCGGTSEPDPALGERPAEVSPEVADPDNKEAWGLYKVQADKAWDIHRGDEKFVVAVIDTGIHYNHEDLAYNVWRNPSPTKDDISGYDFVHDDPLPYDDQGHGSHCAGTVGATGFNGKGVSGVAPRVAIMGLKFLTKSGSGGIDGAIKSIDYAVKNGAKVLSNSWGAEQLPQSKALSDAIQRSQDAGTLFVAAAGNGDRMGNGYDIDKKAVYPAGFDHENIIAVAATKDDDGFTRFSNWGKKRVDIAAPGKDIYSTIPKGAFPQRPGFDPEAEYVKISGTSMATPHVAGAAAMVWSKNPSWDWKQVKAQLLKTVDKVSAHSGKTVTGGRLNVYRALTENN